MDLDDRSIVPTNITIMQTHFQIMSSLFHKIWEFSNQNFSVFIISEAGIAEISRQKPLCSCVHTTLRIANYQVKDASQLKS